jgi:hypothetical protein
MQVMDEDPPTRSWAALQMPSNKMNGFFGCDAGLYMQGVLCRQFSLLPMRPGSLR